jgi:hypothetical protein
METSISTAEHRKLGADCSQMVRLDRFVSAPEKLDIVKEFIENMSHEHFEKYNVLPPERQAYLLRLYAEKNHNTSLGIVPYTS